MAETPSAGSDLEKLRQLYAEYARGDLSRRDIFDPEVVSHAYGIWPEGEAETHRLEELSASTSGWLESWEHPFVIEAQEFIESGSRIAVRVHWRGKARWGGGEVESENTHVWEFRDGRATRFDVYRDHEEALAALHAE